MDKTIQKEFERSIAAIQALAGGLVVSCQASEGEPLDAPQHICALALSALNGGACALRLEGVENISYVRKHVEVPIIGLAKSKAIKPVDRVRSVFITATFAEAKEIAAAGADIIALDATGRSRPDGLSLKETITMIHEQLGKSVWADIATVDEAVYAEESGADLITTTLYGYTEETQKSEEAGPDFELVERMCQRLNRPVALEGRIWSPYEVTKAFELGVHCVSVGSAITRPQLITRRFVNAIPDSCR